MELLKALLLVIAGFVEGLWAITMLIEAGYLTYTVNPPDKKSRVTFHTGKRNAVKDGEPLK